jgi:DNA-binding transcriptional LysR family regulator
VFLRWRRPGASDARPDGLHLSQPALSQHVGELERGLGARFFDRRGRTVTLTEAGRILEDHALRLFATLAGAREAIAELDGVGRGTLVVGASTTPGIYLMPALMGEFERAYPGISVDLRIRQLPRHRGPNTRERAGPRGGRRPRAPCGEKCLAARLPDELVVDRAADPPLAGAPPSRPCASGPGAPVDAGEGSATRQVTERALERASVRIGRTLELGHTEAIKQAVMAGLGVAFVSIHAARGELATGRLKRVRLRGLRIQRHFHVIRNESRSLTARAQAFIDNPPE